MWSPIVKVEVQVRSISEISSCFVGPRPWHIEVRHRVKQTSAINLFGFGTLKLKIRRLKLWKSTVVKVEVQVGPPEGPRHECNRGQDTDRSLYARVVLEVYGQFS